MEIGEQGSASKNNKKLPIEDYLDFIKNRDHQLSNGQLRKIITVHGYRGIQIKKSMLLDAVKTIDLMDLRRSTLKDDSVSGDASLTLASVIKDLNDLQWQECHVTSFIIQGVDAATVPVNRKKSKGLSKKPAMFEADDSIGSIAGIDVDSSTNVVKIKRLEDLENNPVEVAADDSTIPTTGTTVAAGSTTVSEKGKNWLGKKTAEVAADDSIISTSSTTAPAKGGKSKGIEKKPDEDASDDSTECTTVAAGGTTASAKRKRINKGCCGTGYTCC